MRPDFLQTLWFVLISVLWIGYFVLEGFDFGVGMLVRTLGRSQAEKRTIIHAIGPVWDGNEVWLLTAGGATFAAFPGWYASLFSGFYLALLLILLSLIVRGVSFEFWGKQDSPRWRATWEWTMLAGSLAAALLWGVGFANIIHGVAMNGAHNVTARIWDLLHPYALLGGVTTLTLFLAHGASFLCLRTEGDLRERARAVAQVTSPVAAALLGGFLLWTVLDQDAGGVKVSATVIAALAFALAIAAPAMVSRRREGAAFALSAGAISLLFASLFVWLYPNALPSTTSHLFDLTLLTAASNHYTLVVMSVVAAVMLPIVLGYQAWTYWVFRHRLGTDLFGTPEKPTPIAVLGQIGGGDGSIRPGSHASAHTTAIVPTDPPAAPDPPAAA
jgi:cytochrome bd ubiquinol oxidase subunit II